MDRSSLHPFSSIPPTWLDIRLSGLDPHILTCMSCSRGFESP